MKKSSKIIISFVFFLILLKPLPVSASNIIDDVPLILQLPELDRGCEVTSLAMLLQHAGVDVDKMTLAEEITKVPFMENGLRGNPYEGFVGNIYTFDEHGLGVYHGPIVDLAERYLPGRIVDLTGRDVSAIYRSIDQGQPVWVIINSWYNELPESEFVIWETNIGELKITYREHSSVVTGYDDQYVYVNDPYYNVKNLRVSRDGFEAAWKQMGSQAVTYKPDIRLIFEEDQYFGEKLSPALIERETIKTGLFSSSKRVVQQLSNMIEHSDQIAPSMQNHFLLIDILNKIPVIQANLLAVYVIFIV